ncbi:MAG: 3-hydroxy-3-methylglutaryl CoA synthase [Deltaproteobacteria bacterium]|nr:3-hydroxy-3-methylglutaryl CoA synthase [Deltaproteobacteria bacterium]
MAGIVRAAGYVPYLKMDRKVIAAAWERSALPGCRSVANHDEDSLTMAAEAAQACLKEEDRSRLSGIFFASTTAPYLEKQAAALLATALDLDRGILTVDYAHSLRSSLSALRLALDAVSAGTADTILVAAADTRQGYPRSDPEQQFGDGAAAVLVGGSNEVLEYMGGYGLNDYITDVWRNPGDRYVRAWEGRFITSVGYMALMKEVISSLLTKLGLKPSEVDRAVVAAPDQRSLKDLLKVTGMDKEEAAADSLLNEVGFTGAAHPLLMLTEALEKARPGQTLLVAGYGDGAEALLFRVAANPASEAPKHSVGEQITARGALNSYARFLSYKESVEPLPGEPFRILPSASATWRERDSLLRCRGSRCRECGEVAFPIQRVCNNCRSLDRFETVRLSGLQGKVFSFSQDNLAGRSDDPVVVQTVVEMENSARFYGLMTDCRPADVRVGMPVRLTLRRFHELGDFHNYFWKCRPVR